MENFEALQDIDNFCKVLVKKRRPDKPEVGGRGQIAPSEKAFVERNNFSSHLESNSASDAFGQPEHEDPLIDVFEEEDHIRILVQCRCREQQVTFHPSDDGLLICREVCYREKDGQETCTDVCRKLNLPTDRLQLDNMLFVIAKCNNNNTLEAMIPKTKQ